ncbi:DNA cytosine methyltransferase [Methyloversatilis discipulorum]|uniref:DNA cytosine methyltransferase n=1 Tax=Methyloversatilis discipulorum TaxID=1119528 RepID=UPI001A4D4D6A|nr:DNA cytosine methyltransferase [Methyloversatilis discipulorum]MBL8469675.1 DNA cytosine methyltransferase [Methyloversatilis discipulorum]
MALHTIELFAGVGMLGEGVRTGFGYLGIETRCVCYVEREAHAAAVLAARIESGALDAAPVWSDVCTFNARRWRGAVDCIVAGFPCQDLSVAGRRAGLDGARSGLFFEVLRIADDSGAEFIVLENVAGIASATASVVDEAEGDLDERAAARVVGELADRGWNAEWLTLSASDVGASHGRERWFCVAWRCVGDSGLQHVDLQQRTHGTESSAAITAMADAGCVKRLPRYVEDLSGAPEAPGYEGDNRAADCCSALADASCPRQQGRELGTALHADRGGQEAHGSASELRGLFAPGPADSRWADILAAHPYLAPALEPAFRELVDGVAFDMGDSRSARLRCVGNGVVPLQAATAVVVLARRAGIVD